MNLAMLGWIACAILVLMGLISLHGSIKLWTSGNKFMGFVFFALTIIIGFAVYAIFGNRIMELFQ